jgi:hypothetical protein
MGCAAVRDSQSFSAGRLLVHIHACRSSVTDRDDADFDGIKTLLMPLGSSHGQLDQPEDFAVDGGRGASPGVLGFANNPWRPGGSRQLLRVGGG